MPVSSASYLFLSTSTRQRISLSCPSSQRCSGRSSNGPFSSEQGCLIFQEKVSGRSGNGPFHTERLSSIPKRSFPTGQTQGFSSQNGYRLFPKHFPGGQATVHSMQNGYRLFPKSASKVVRQAVSTIPVAFPTIF